MIKLGASTVDSLKLGSTQIDRVMLGSTEVWSAAPAGNPLADGVVAAWHLDEASGTRYDAGPNALHLTENNGIGSATAKFGANAAQFVSANEEWLSHADDPLLRLGAGKNMTISVWVYFDGAMHSQHLVSKATWAVGGNKTDYTLMYHSAMDAFAFFVWNADGSVNTSASPNNGYATNAWNHIVATYNSATGVLKCYRNNGGTYSATLSGASRVSTVDFMLGKMPGWAGLNGRLDEVVIWNRVLTDAERTELWNGGSGLAYPF